MSVEAARYEVKLAATEAERQGAQRLRYRVFVEEMGAAASPEEQAVRREWDEYDAHFDHLVLIDRSAEGDPLDRVVGAYRVMTSEAAARGRGYYGAGEYDVGPIERSGRRALELGRSCIAREHRGGPGMHLLWNGLAEYVLEREIEILFGVASFHGTDPAPYAEALSHLHHAHLAPADLRVRAREPDRIDMNMLPQEAVDPKRATKAVPPLIKAYLRLGGFVGDGAYRDRDFNTIDVCLIMDTQRMVARYRAFYEKGWEPKG